MRSKEYVTIASSEANAEEFLRREGLLRKFTECIHCGGRRLCALRALNVRCKDCRRAWSRRKGSVLSGSNVSCQDFVMLLRNFEQEMPALACAKDLGLHRNTVNKFYRLLREALSGMPSPTLKGEVEADESYFGGRRKGKRGRGAAKKKIVFGIIERNAKVVVKVVPDVKAETLLRQTIKIVKRGSLVYTDKFSSYDGLVSHGFRHERLDKKKHFANGKVYINGIEGFWSFAKERLHKFHGVSTQHFPLYLKEMEVRYNHRGEDFFMLVVSSLAEFVSRNHN